MDRDRPDVSQLLRDSSGLLGVGAGFLLDRHADPSPYTRAAGALRWWSSLRSRLSAIFRRRGALR